MELLTLSALSLIGWGSTILAEIAKAARLCSAGIFLFTKDDLIDGPDRAVAVPRDNVVFEAGFFAHAKGSDRVLIILEQGTKLPADLGGTIFVTLERTAGFEELNKQLRSFLEQQL